MLAPSGSYEAYPIGPTSRRRPPALAARDQTKQKSAAPQSKARAESGPRLGAASRDHESFEMGSANIRDAGLQDRRRHGLPEAIHPGLWSGLRATANDRSPKMLGRLPRRYAGQHRTRHTYRCTDRWRTSLPPKLAEWRGLRSPQRSYIGERRRGEVEMTWAAHNANGSVHRESV